MNNFDLVGEMSLEQLEHNIENLHGKEKATELVDILRHAKVDHSMQNKFYASVFNKIQTQNSIDSILKNPTQIIASVEKDLINLKKLQQEDLEIKTAKQAEYISHISSKLLENPNFIKSPINYLSTFSVEEQKEFLNNLFSNYFDFGSDEEKNEAISAMSEIIQNPDAPIRDTSKIAILKFLGQEDNNKLYDNDDDFLTLCNISIAVAQYCEENNLSITELTEEQYKEFLKIGLNESNPNFKKISKNFFEGLQKKIKENPSSKDFSNEAIYKHAKSFLDQLGIRDSHDIDLDNIDLDAVFSENFQNAVDLYNPNTILQNDFDINIIGTFDEQTELLQQILDSNAEPQQDIPQQSVPIGTVEYIQQQMQEQKALEELEQSEKASNTPEKTDLAESSETNDNSYLVEVNEKKSFFQTIKSGVSNFFKRINQKSLPNPNESKAKHTNMSLDDYDRKASFMSAIRSFGDKITNATKAITNLSKANKQPLNTPASMDYQNNSGQNLDISGNPSSANTKKDFIKPKAVETVAKSQPRESHTNFDKFIKVNNAGNKIEQAAMSTKKTPNTTNISQTKSNGQSHDDNDEQQFVE
jgi:hypothetical protein